VDSLLRPGGFFLHCWDKLTLTDNRDIGSAWERIVNALGGQVKCPGSASAGTDVTAWLQERGLHPQEMHVACWETTKTVRQEVESM